MVVSLTISTDSEASEKSIEERHRRTSERWPVHNQRIWEDHVLVSTKNDEAALGRLVEEYQRYALSLAAKLHRGHEPREDLNQIALESLVTALKRFEPERGIPFPAFATPTILGAIRRHYRDHGWLVRVPRSVHEFVGAQRETTERLSGALSRLPTESETASAMSITTQELRAASMALHARDTRSLDAVNGDEAPLGERIGAEDPALTLAENRLAAATAIKALDTSSQRLLRLYFYEEYTQAEIAEILQVSQTQVSRLLRYTLRQLRSLVGAHHS